MYLSTKTFQDFPCAHRQYRHNGNCSFVHGYSRSFTLTFSAKQQDRCGFVVDFGDLKWLRHWLEDKFDHTLLIEDEDPLLEDFIRLNAAGGCKLIQPPYGVGMEGSARWVLEVAQAGLDARTDPYREVKVLSVEARENQKNSAIYYNPEVASRLILALPAAAQTE